MIFFLLVLILIILDQITKYFAMLYLQPIGSFPIIPDIFEFAYVENRGAAFGILQNQRWLFIGITFIVIGIMIYYYFRIPNEKKYRWLQLSFILIISGAVGNLIDRIRFSYVVDFFYFKLIDFPVFNAADCYVVIGTILLAILFLFVYHDFSFMKGVKNG